MNSREIRKKFLEYFEEKGHTVVPSSSLVPEDDSTVLFTTAGMQQFKPYYIGAKDAKKDFKSLNTASSQKCMRTSDIDEVGDDTHLTFFEMLGNFSFGGPSKSDDSRASYFKKEAIEYAYDFIVNEMGLKIDYVSIFEGDDLVPEDTESFEIWESLGISSKKIKKLGREDNFWGPTGDEGPCGPTTEIYVNGVEIWNIVFNEYYCKSDNTLMPLEKKGVDTGMGLERLVVAVQKKNHIFETDLFAPIIEKISSLSNADKNEKGERIVADHIKASIFLIADGVVPSNTDQGYILRRLLRRAIRYMNTLNIDNSLSDIINTVVSVYGEVYLYLETKKESIKKEIVDEEEKFKSTLEKGLKQFEKLEGTTITGKDAFMLFSTYGFPLEITIELAEEKGGSVDVAGFKKEMASHQEISKAGVQQKFKGGLAGHGEQEIKYHTATHLLHQALREVLGNHVVQKGSNITADRLRFDFSHPEKMTDEEKSRVADLINEKIKEELPVTMTEMSIEDARGKGALGIFDEKYEEKVKVYQIGDKDNIFSFEICGGPHVQNTQELGLFEIKKEESTAQGIRRIKAVLN